MPSATASPTIAADELRMFMHSVSSDVAARQASARRRKHSLRYLKESWPARITLRHEALVYRGPGLKSLEDHQAEIQAPGDAIVKILKRPSAPTCHPQGRCAPATPGRILGHEGVGVVEDAVGAASRPQGGRPCADLVHLRAASAELPPRRIFALRHRWLDPGQHHRRHAGQYIARPHADTS
jgi:hypothetical protein